MSDFRLTAAQAEAMGLLGGAAQHVMLFGGSRSGKTFLEVRAIVVRALAASDSRHLIARFRYNAVVASIILDTFPKVMKLCFPGVVWGMKGQNSYALLPNGSQIWFAGLDDKDRTEKILGMEFATILLNECSQIPKGSRDMIVTRLAQMARIDGTDLFLRLKMFYDENPPTKGHWSYKLFVQKRDPETREVLKDGHNYAAMQMNPDSNRENLPPGYIETTLRGLSKRLQRRFLEGEFADDNPNALFREEWFDRWRVEGDEQLPDMIRIVVAVDPSGAAGIEGETNDAIGIVVAGLGVNGIAYVLADRTVTASPAVWGKIVCTAFTGFDADIVVGEGNFGGAMVGHVVQSAAKEMGIKVPFKLVTASRGKVIRAEPMSSLYEDGKVRHFGPFPDLEDELCGFSTQGYMGERSPNRADGAIWAVAELFPGLIAPRKQENKTPEGLREILDRPPLWSA